MRTIAIKNAIYAGLDKRIKKGTTVRLNIDDCDYIVEKIYDNKFKVVGKEEEYKMGDIAKFTNLPHWKASGTVNINKQLAGTKFKVQRRGDKYVLMQEFKYNKKGYVDYAIFKNKNELILNLNKLFGVK